MATQDRMVSAPKVQRAPVLVPQINKYGSLVGLKDSTGKNLLKTIKHRWREGYAIAYQVKNSKGVNQDRFVYVMGGRVSARKLKVEHRKSTSSRKIVTTREKALEIGRVITWDEKSQALKSIIRITNTSKRDVGLRAIELDIDKSVAARLIAQGGASLQNLYDLPDPCPVPQSGIGISTVAIRGSMDCSVGDDCPGCGCIRPPFCKSGEPAILDRDPLNRWPVNIQDLIGPRLPKFKRPMLCLSWTGSSLSRSVLKPGEQIMMEYRINIPRPRE